MNMYIRLASIRISSKHKQIVRTRIPHSFDCSYHHLQQFRALKISKVLDRFNMEILQVFCQLVTDIFLRNIVSSAELLMILYHFIGKFSGATTIINVLY